MTEQEAIKCLTGILDECTSDESAVSYVTDVDEIPLKMGIIALEKQILKQWDYEQSDECDIYICPCCKERFFLEWGTPKDNEYNYCPHCGQRLDWE